MRPLAPGLAASLLLVAGCGGGSAEPDRYEIEAVFASKRGVEKGTPVRIAGANAGRIARVEPGPRGTFVATLDLGRKPLFPLHADATVKVRPRIFKAGRWFLDIDPGTPSLPKLPDGARVPRARTASPGEASGL